MPWPKTHILFEIYINRGLVKFLKSTHGETVSL